MNTYETPRLLDEYLLFHFGTADEMLPYAGGPADALNFAVRTVVENVAATPLERALDLGCAVGRSSFELARFCAQVVGIDSSHAFIQAAQQLQHGDDLPYRRHDEAHRFTPLVARAPAHLPVERVSFEQGDAMDLRAGIGTFDLVHAANLLCRLPEPARLLNRLPALARPGATLILTTPCTWLAEFTPPEHWPANTTLDWLREHLDPEFSLQAVRDQPFLLRETARKYQWTVAQATVWKRR